MPKKGGKNKGKKPDQENKSTPREEEVNNDIK